MNLLPRNLFQWEPGEREGLYDLFYQDAASVLDVLNPCRFAVTPKGVTCAAGTPCCHQCDHLSKRGCTVQSLACKMWLCPEVTYRWAATASSLFADGLLRRIQRTCQQQGVPHGFRASRQENF